ncbi:MAG: MBL fold metallo-hydrolase, partial [Candidatus Adiutrix sp.]
MSHVEYIWGDTGQAEFDGMFGGWLVQDEGRTFLVECGVRGGAKSLVEKLRAKTKHIDYLLLTHIHMDHAGGAAEILDAFSGAKIILHEKGLRHLAQPERLWASTKEIMRELAEMYGEPRPLDPNRLIAHTTANIKGLQIFETPGHAPHHLSFRIGDIMFVGEAGGCPSLIDGKIHSRPATAPRYLPHITIASIDRLLQENCQWAYFGHDADKIPYREALEIYKA